MTRPEARATGSAGFTLLEVLVAAAVLLLVYGTLARMNIEGLQAVGDASRRLRASLLADAAIAEIETQVRSGSAPPPGQVESEADGFRVEVAVTPFEFPLPPPADGSQRPPAKLLAAPSGPTPSALRKVAVRVTWSEGLSERAVSRTDFVFDLAAAREVLAALGATGEEDADEEQAPAEETPPAPDGEDEGS
jgi:prepilin-type N-terminal cleavage/methylation domain-containing protein